MPRVSAPRDSNSVWNQPNEFHKDSFALVSSAFLAWDNRTSLAVLQPQGSVSVTDSMESTSDMEAMTSYMSECYSVEKSMPLDAPEALSASLSHWDYSHQMHCLVNFPLVPWERVSLNKPIWFSNSNDCNSIFLNLSFKWCALSPSIFKESSPQAFLRRWTHCIIKPVVFRMWFRILAHVRRHLPHAALPHYWKSMKPAINHPWQASHSDRKREK